MQDIFHDKQGLTGTVWWESMLQDVQILASRMTKHTRWGRV